MVDIIQGDCLLKMAEMPANSVDAIVSDPPYGLSFMGKDWDHGVPGVPFWTEALRVLKPGGHLLAFGGTRTFHRLVVAIEDAGFEIRDQIAWLYGQGFPKSHNLQGDWQGWGTALKPAWETVVVASKPFPFEEEFAIIRSSLTRLEAKLWSLLHASPAETSSTSSRSAFAEVFAIAQWTAEDSINTRAALCGAMDTLQFEMATTTSLSIVSSWKGILGDAWSAGSTFITEMASRTTIDWRTLSYSLSRITPESIIRACSLPGGFNANATIAEQHFNGALALLKGTLTLSVTEPVISQVAQSCLDADVTIEPICVARKPLQGTVAANWMNWGTGALNIDASRIGGDGGRWPSNLIHDGSDEVLVGFPGEGDKSAARYFYCPKASKKDRDEGLEGFALGNNMRVNCPRKNEAAKHATLRANTHPTVKPTDLMRYLVRLVTPPGGVVLDPFCGSGSTGKAAVMEGFRFIGIELQPEYAEIARARIAAAMQKPVQPEPNVTEQMQLFTLS